MKNQDIKISRRNFLATSGMFTASFLYEDWDLVKPVSPVTIIITAAAKTPITVQKLQENFSVLLGSGGNIIVFNGPEGKLMIDAGISVSKDKIKKALAGISDQPVKHLINTHWHFDHASGNEWIHQTGATIIAHAKTRANLMKTIRVEDWNHTFTPAPKGALPTILFDNEHTLHMNGETIKLHHYGPAHTDCDTSVHFENADVLHVADTWWNGHYPFIDHNSGGNIKGMIRAANGNLQHVSAKTIIVPGHGPVGNKEQMIEYRDMLEDITAKIESLKKQGRSLKEIVASKPTKSYDAKWGTYVIDPDLFTKLVYRGV